MKNKLFASLTLAFLSTLNLQLSTARAQGTAFTYQGRLTENGALANGVYDFEFRVFDAGTSGTQQGGTVTVNALGVTNGLFTATLNPGAGVFTGADRWLEIGVVTNGGGAFTTLAPRQSITPTPYAIRATEAGYAGAAATANSFTGPLAGEVAGPQGATTVALVGGETAANVATGAGAANAATSANTPNTIVKRDGSGNFSAGDITATSFSGSGAGLTGLNAAGLTGTIPDAQLSANVSLLGASIESAEITDGTMAPDDLNLAAFNTAFWRATGNAGTAAGTHFLGTTDNQPVEIKVNGLRALRLEPNASGAPNVIAGSPLNFVGAGVVGATIAGGGATSYSGAALTNSVLSDFGVVGGGRENTIAANSWSATIAGGVANDIGTSSHYSAIGGGYDNNIAALSESATIAGGIYNDIGAYSVYSTIGGGYDNNIAANSWFATIAGGGFNDIGTNSDYSAIGGGEDNNIAANAEYATIAGGNFNDIGANSDYSAIGGGGNNKIEADSVYTTIAGGGFNEIGTNSYYSAIGGGDFNKIAANSPYATIPGGRFNAAASYAFAAGYRARANHTGAFVWADSTDAFFASTANNQFLIRAAGGVGIGTTSPGAPLQIGDANTLNSQGMMRFTSRSGTGGATRSWDIGVPEGDQDLGGKFYSFVIDDPSFNGTEPEFMIRWDTGNVGIGVTNPASKLHVNGTVTATAFNPPSDRNLKENFAPVSPREVLEKVAALPISRWNFIGDAATPHVGPMAQDFHAAFALGTDNKHIATVDADGVALAAIQGLNQKLEETRAENSELKARLERLERLFDQNAR